MNVVKIHYNPLYRIWTSTVGSVLGGSAVLVVGVFIVLGIEPPRWVVVLCAAGFLGYGIDSAVTTVIQYRKRGRDRRRAYADADRAWAEQDDAAYVAAVDRLGEDVDLATLRRRAEARSRLDEAGGEV